MSMTLTVKKADIQLPPAKTQRAVISEILDLGEQQTPFGMQDRILFVFEFPDDPISSGEAKGKPNIMWYETSKVISKKSKLGDLLRALVDRDLIDGEHFSLEKDVLGKMVMLQIVHSKKMNGGVKADIVSISHPHESIPVVKAHYPLKHLDLDEFDQALFDSLSESKKKKINLTGVKHAATGEF